MPSAGLLFAGDTLEDPITYVGEPERLTKHLDDLERMPHQVVMAALGGSVTS